MLVVNKPAGVSVTKDRTGAAELKDILAKQLGPETIAALRLVHQLDKETSGVLVLAKTKETQSTLSACFAKTLVKKTYLAFVSAKVTEPQGVIDAPLAEHPHVPGLMYVPKKKGKKAVTKWNLLADFGPVALLAVQPVTDRTHQIRVHLRYARMPLAIDPLYGSDKPLFLSSIKHGYRLGREQTENPLIERLTLHAYQIEFNATCHPDRDKESSVIAGEAKQSQGINCFIAPLDKKFAVTIKLLTRHNPKGPEAFIRVDDFDRITGAQRLC